MQSPRTRVLVVGVVLLVLVLGGISVFTPFLGRARLGPMRGFGAGPMSLGIMREVRAMADLDSQFDYVVRMIPHHMAAVMMSEQLLSQVDVDHSELETLAGNIRTAQTQEIRQMTRWMDEWFN